MEGAGDTSQSLNASFPQNATTWKALVNNTSANATTFIVYAVCGVVQ